MEGDGNPGCYLDNLDKGSCLKVAFLVLCYKWLSKGCGFQSLVMEGWKGDRSVAQVTHGW